MQNSLSGAQKIALQLITLLLVCCCALFICILSSFSSYNVKVDSDLPKDDGRFTVWVEIKDKLTDGYLANAYIDDYFTSNYNPNKQYRGADKIGIWDYERPVLYTTENVSAMKEIALKDYKNKCTNHLLIAGLLAIGVLFIRKIIIKKFNSTL